MWRNFAEPLIGRLGTFIGGNIAMYGIAADHANMIGYGVAAAVFVAVDLVTRRFAKK